MRLIIVRHAIAVERGTPGIPDDERPLTPAGEKKFRQAARGLARIAPLPGRLLTSPLPRARRTAELAAKAWGTAAPEPKQALAGGDFDDLATLLDAHAADDVVAIFGHEPQLSELLARLLSARDDARLAFRKGGAALVDLPAGLAQGGRLLWFLPPHVLRELGK